MPQKKGTGSGGARKRAPARKKAAKKAGKKKR